MKINSRGYGGRRLSKTAAVVSNDPRRPTVSLNVFGMVEHFADIEPQRVVLKGVAGDSIRQSVSIQPKAKYPFRIVGVKADSGKNISFELVETDDPVKGSYRLNVENRLAVKGRYRDTIVLETDSAVRDALRVGVYGTIAAQETKGDGAGNE